MVKRILAFFAAAALMTALLCGCKHSNDDNIQEGTSAGTDAGTQPVPVSEHGDDTGEPDVPTYVPTVAGFDLPESSDEMSAEFALELLRLCTGHYMDATAALFSGAGFDVKLQKYYDKDPSDTSHTAAYTIGLGYAEHGGKVRPVVLIAVRGTVGGEWYSNFDVVPSHNPAAVYSENFLAAAEDIFLGAQKTLSECDSPLIVVCGHSRGAACANLLGTMLDRIYPASDVFVYTFATPATLKNGGTGQQYGNIFNFINPEDFVTYLPLAEWGFSRAGNDIILSADETAAAIPKKCIDDVLGAAPDIRSYYGTRYSVSGPGTSENGVTVFELMSAVAAGALAGEGEQQGMIAFLSPDSELFRVAAALGALSETGFSAHMPNVYADKIAALEG